MKLRESTLPAERTEKNHDGWHMIWKGKTFLTSDSVDVHRLSGIRPLHHWLQDPAAATVRCAPHRAVAEAHPVDPGNAPDFDSSDGSVGRGVCTVGPVAPASASVWAVRRGWDGRGGGLEPITWIIFEPTSFNCTGSVQLRAYLDIALLGNCPQNIQ